ncbi:hypothetical protein [Parafilimonas sp.]|uniref:hypothetical protein n=1 Tax=Parafilimonas sp. TaxID=1969739 RepID=UPI0039E54B98
MLGVRGAYHYTDIDNDEIDVYGGATISYNMLSYKYSDNAGNNDLYDTGNYGSTAGVTAFVGGRYYFISSVAAMAEVGYGVSYLTVVLSLKF